MKNGLIKTAALVLSLVVPSVANADQTNCVHIIGNLDASSVITAVPALPVTYSSLASASFSTFFTISDSLHAAHTITAYYFHTGANSWVVSTYIDSSDTSATGGAPVLIGQSNITFSSTGIMLTPATDPSFAMFITFNNGSAIQNTGIRLHGTTQFASTSAISSVAECTGPPANSPSELDFDDDFVDDVVFYRERTKSIVIEQSKTGTEKSIRFGTPNDQFLIGDYTGDHNPDIVSWHYRIGFLLCVPGPSGCSSLGRFILGKKDDKPIRGDFDGDGIQDLAVWRKKDGKIYYLQSFQGFQGPVLSLPGNARGDKLLTGAAR